MDCSQVVVQQLNVASGHLKRGWAVTEDSLQREDVASVGEGGAGEAVTQDVRRAARRHSNR